MKMDLFLNKWAAVITVHTMSNKGMRDCKNIKITISLCIHLANLLAIAS